jgi:hypothetical protein
MGLTDWSHPWVIQQAQYVLETHGGDIFGTPVGHTERDV